MAIIKSKFSVGQKVNAIKSGKTGDVTAIVVTATGVTIDVQFGTSKRPWRCAEADLQTQADADKAAKAKLKAAKPVVVKPSKPAAVKASKPAAKKAPKKAKVAKK